MNVYICVEYNEIVGKSPSSKYLWNRLIKSMMSEVSGILDSLLAYRYLAELRSSKTNSASHPNIFSGHLSPEKTKTSFFVLVYGFTPKTFGLRSWGIITTHRPFSKKQIFGLSRFDLIHTHTFFFQPTILGAKSKKDTINI